MWRLIRSYWWSKKRWDAWLLLLSMLLLGWAVVAINVRINEWSRVFYDTLAEFKGEDLYALIFQYLFYVGIFIVCAVYRAWLRKLLVIRWRTHLTEELLERWFKKRAFYRMRHSAVMDNPDQRIAEDVQIFVARTIELFISLFTNILQLYSFLMILWGLSGVQQFEFFGISWTVHGYLVWIALFYALFGSAITHWIGHKLHGLNYDQQRFEADFRASLLRKQEYAEQIAFYRGEAHEQKALREDFFKIIKNWRKLMNKERDLGFFTTGYDRFALMLPVLVSIPLFMVKVITLGGLMQIRSAFTAVFNSLSWFVFAYSVLPEWSATLSRLKQFQYAIDKAQAEERPAPLGTALSFRGLDVYTPQGDLLLKGVKAEIKKGVWTQLLGASGVGKSSLLRTVAGLWSDYQGDWHKPEVRELLLPQKPYIATSTLAEALSYPEIAPYPEKALIEALQAVGLEARLSSLDEIKAWQNELSLGEQQRLSIARALLYAPDYLYLDESFSHLDYRSAGDLILKLKTALPQATVILVSHQENLQKYCDDFIDLTPFSEKVIDGK